MRTEIISNMESWNNLRKMLLEFHYRIWQTPYRVNSPKGFRAMFICSINNKDDVIEVITCNRKVTEAILEYPYW